MARRKSTRKGQRRKTARRAYIAVKRRTRRARAYTRRTYAAARRRSTGLIKSRSMGALKECAWITGGSAAGLAANRYMPAGVMGYGSDMVFGAGALAWGLYKNDPKPIYLGFGALYPRIYTQLQSVIG